MTMGLTHLPSLIIRFAKPQAFRLSSARMDKPILTGSRTSAFRRLLAHIQNNAVTPESKGGDLLTQMAIQGNTGHELGLELFTHVPSSACQRLLLLTVMLNC